MLSIKYSRRIKPRDFALKEGEKIKYFKKGEVFFFKKIKYFKKGEVFFFKYCTFGKIYGIMVEKNNDFPFL